MEQQRRRQLLMRRPHLHTIPEPPPLPDSYTLRSYTGEADLKPLASTLSLSFNTDWSEERVRWRLTEAPDVKAVYVVAWHDTPVATASSRYLPERFPDTGYVHWVGTHPDHQGKGLASALMARLLADFQERGYREAVLETDDFRIPAIRTYLKFGFLPVYDVDGEDHRDRWSEVFQTLMNRS